MFESVAPSDLHFSIPEVPRRLKRSWELGANTCHAPMVMRSDLQKQMRRSHQELGFRYWRAHGTLSDDVSIYSPGPNGEAQYTFSGLRRILDAVLDSGMKPFFELSFMPSALASRTGDTITHYNGITSPPSDFRLWEDLVGAVTRFLWETYGEAELKTWYFEVWNEPNIPFWTGTRDEYFQLYSEFEYRHLSPFPTGLHSRRELRMDRNGGEPSARNGRFSYLSTLNFT